MYGNWLKDIKEKDIINSFKNPARKVNKIEYIEDKKFGIIMVVYFFEKTSKYGRWIDVGPRFYSQFGEVDKISNNFMLSDNSLDFHSYEDRVSHPIICPLPADTHYFENEEFIEFMVKQTKGKKINNKTYLEEYFEEAKNALDYYRTNTINRVNKYFEKCFEVLKEKKERRFANDEDLTK